MCQVEMTDLMQIGASPGGQAGLAEAARKEKCQVGEMIDTTLS